MAKSPKIEPADQTSFQTHSEIAAKIGLRRLRRQDPVHVLQSLGLAYHTEQNDERRRLIMSTRLCLLNEQLQKLWSSPPAAAEAKPKAKKPKPEPEPEVIEPEPAPPPPPPKKEAKLDMMDLGNAAMLLMASDEDDTEDETPEDPMDFLTSDDTADKAKTNNDIDDDMMAFLTSSDEDDAEDAATSQDDIVADASEVELSDADLMAFLSSTDDDEADDVTDATQTASTETGNDTDMAFLAGSDDPTSGTDTQSNVLDDDMAALLAMNDNDTPEDPTSVENTTFSTEPDNAVENDAFSDMAALLAMDDTGASDAQNDDMNALLSMDDTTTDAPATDPVDLDPMAFLTQNDESDEHSDRENETDTDPDTKDT